MEVDRQTFIPGRHKLAAGESLAPDPTTYDLLHTLESTWPCLSFDILRDNLGEGRARKKYPATVYTVAGTQAAQGHEKENEILVMKMSSLSRMDRPQEEESESDDSDDDDENSDPVLETRNIKLDACTNRIRKHQIPQSDPSKPQNTFTAAMLDNGQVVIHDITPHLTSFDTPGAIVSAQQNAPIHTIKAHKSVEGYAVDWSSSPTSRKLLTGDASGKIFHTTLGDGGAWTTDSRPFAGHVGSVEELQWSPSEANVFASASSDGCVKIWDLRSKAHKAAVSVQVSQTDVNVLSWSPLQSYLLASGADDGQWAVWDLRQWKPSSGGGGGNAKPSSVAEFGFHKEQITSVEWHPTDDSIVAVAAGDNTLTLWDLAVELDDEESQDTAGVQDVPPQLLFVHYMEQVKECHWHPQQPGLVMATGGSGFGYVFYLFWLGFTDDLLVSSRLLAFDSRCFVCMNKYTQERWLDSALLVPEAGPFLPNPPRSISEEQMASGIRFARLDMTIAPDSTLFFAIKSRLQLCRLQDARPNSRALP